MPKVFDLFCGTGGFSKGFENAHGREYEIVFGNDLFPVITSTFQLNHPNALATTGDVRKVSCEEISQRLGLKAGQLDVIIGGPPCQGFSSIRPFRSHKEDDPRNSLFEEFARFVNYFRPNKFVLENVVGLATYKNGQTIQQILECFSNLGYECDWKILNAANFGVPQKRERLIMLGVEKGGKINFPKPTHYSDDTTIGHRDKAKLISTRLEGIKKLNKAITVMEAIGDLPKIKSGEEGPAYIEKPRNSYQKARRSRSKKLTLHSSTDHSEKMLNIIKHSGSNIYSLPPGLVTSGFSSCYSRLDPDKPSVTITVNFVHPASNRCIHPILDRALTPREGARLQSYDDDFLFAGNRSQIVKQIGNAVPPLLGQVIAEAL